MLVLAFTGLATGLLVTERRRTEMQLRLQQEEHARIARLGSMDELATNIAHEINQPLMAAGTYSRLVARNLDAGTGDPQVARDAAAKAVAQVERAADVVRSLRTLVRLGRSDTAPIAVSRLVSAAVDLVLPMLSSGHIVIRQDIPADLPMVMVDALQIEQVLINLMRNSIEAISSSARARGTIIVSAGRRDGQHVEISVRDTGPGFTPSQLANLAAPFKTTKADGLGIGLALSRSIVEAHGGRLWATPSADGAHVYLTLPTAEARPS
jgi:C4-dicarboxylate-specific signal transduction histidine kinase